MTASLQRTKTPPNESAAYDNKQSDVEVSVMAGILGIAEYTFIDIAPRSTLARSGST